MENITLIDEKELGLIIVPRPIDGNSNTTFSTRVRSKYHLNTDNLSTSPAMTLDQLQRIAGALSLYVEMACSFKKGAKVYCDMFGEGYVQYILDMSSPYPVGCRFSGGTHNFSIEGRYVDSDKLPSLRLLDK